MEKITTEETRLITFLLDIHYYKVVELFKAGHVADYAKRKYEELSGFDEREVMDRVQMACGRVLFMKKQIEKLEKEMLIKCEGIPTKRIFFFKSLISGLDGEYLGIDPEKNPYKEIISAMEKTEKHYLGVFRKNIKAIYRNKHKPTKELDIKINI